MQRKTPSLCGTRIASVQDCPFRSGGVLPQPERLVGLGFRYWMLGRLRGDVASWEQAWGLYTGVFGVTGGKVAISNLAGWVGALDRAGQRNIEVHPRSCPGFCRDECVAISLIAACQHRTCPALRACAFALVDGASIDDVVEHAQGFADSLAGLDYMLSPASIVATPASLPLSGQLLH